MHRKFMQNNSLFMPIFHSRAITVSSENSSLFALQSVKNLIFRYPTRLFICIFFTIQRVTLSMQRFTSHNFPPDAHFLSKPIRHLRFLRLGKIGSQKIYDMRQLTDTCTRLFQTFLCGLMKDSRNSLKFLASQEDFTQSIWRISPADSWKEPGSRI